MEPDGLIAAGAYPGFCSMKRLEVFLLPLDGMLVHRRSLPRNFVRFPQQFAGTHLYTWVERGTVRVKCLAKEHNTMSPSRTRTRSAQSRVVRTNHEATVPPTVFTDTHQLFQNLQALEFVVNITRVSRSLNHWAQTRDCNCLLNTSLTKDHTKVSETTKKF